MNKKNILLVGGGGYIGQALYQILKKKNQVKYTNRKKQISNSDHFYLDFNKQTSINKLLQKEEFDFIIILASKIEITSATDVDFKQTIFKDNVFGFNNFLKTLNTYQKKARLIYISSMTVYNQNAVLPALEETRLSPFHTYGLSKILAEQLFSFYISNSENKGVIVRLPGVYGGQRKKGFIFNAINKFKNNETLIIDTKGMGFWETIYINDLVSMMEDFLQKYKFIQMIDIFNFGYGKETDFIKTAFLLKKILKSKSEIKIKNQDYQKFFLSNKKLSKVINLKKYSFETSLRKYIKEIL